MHCEKTINRSMDFYSGVSGLCLFVGGKCMKKTMREIKTPANPSRKATARVKNPLPVPTECRFCHSAVRVATHHEVYGRNYSEWPYVYLCQGCRAYVGLHPFTNIPLGTPADNETRLARKLAKEPFKVLHKAGYMSRSAAYAWLAEQLEIPTAECHFGWFDIGLCKKAEEISLRRLVRSENARKQKKLREQTT